MKSISNYRSSKSVQTKLKHPIDTNDWKVFNLNCEYVREMENVFILKLPTVKHVPKSVYRVWNKIIRFGLLKSIFDLTCAERSRVANA